MPRIIGYGICGAGEADKYLSKALDTFENLCDDVIICLNNATDKEREAIIARGFHVVEDNREWGLNQWKIKQDFVDNHVRKLNPDICVALDMDEELLCDREDIEKYLAFGEALQVYVVNLWGNGYRKDRSFWNARIFTWSADIKFEEKALHCGLVPRWAWHDGVYSPLMLIHYGLKDKTNRQRKIKRYDKYDPDQKWLKGDYYQSLHKDDYDKLDIDELQAELNDYFNKYKPIKRREVRIMTEEKLVALRRKSDGMLIRIPEGQVKEHLDRKDKTNGETMFERVSKEKKTKEKPSLGIAPDEPAKESTGNKCDVCGYEAKTKAGLKVHSRRHEG